MLRDNQVTAEFNHFKSKMLRGTQMLVGVIHSMSEMLWDNQVTVRVNHLKSKMQGVGGSFTSCQK